MSSLLLLAELAAIAIVFAGLPLAYLWTRPSYNFFQKLNWVLVFMTFDLIVFGAFTRLTDSGLGCPDWPGCYGTSNPWHAIGEIQMAQASMPTGPVTVIKAWIEMIHRYLAMTVGALILIQLVVACSKLRSLGKKPVLGSLGLLLLVCIQGAFGAWTVTLKLQPIIVTIHLMLALVLLACLTTYAQQDWEEKTSSALRFQTKPLSAKLLLLASVALLAQIFLGAWVSTNYAVLACPDFPTCMGTLWPETDWQEGFTLWRALGLNAQGESISPVALQTIHWAHRVFAVVAIAALSLLGISALRLSGSELLGMGKLAKLLLGLLILQALTGISNVVFQWPLLAALMHTAGSASLVFCLVRLAQWSSWNAPIQIKMVKSL
ncbi:MAG: heme A synthase [Polynucleobacter sp. 24-46-87]|jgi:cytochrome c oxidase assembly protein subunit 15|uniref:COX15/CtaA family protein n=1 Tax=unclassified Polynucleobacter TaxID=2640945 RepID=UPI000BC38A17|nr:MULTISPECIES: COX15/CtaA family protein [unclassified Polynucleobacter]OYY21877.1 MAG: heme A synthase [Polynucleobacter sp. 35-46-11]OZA16091.1 MAG: heme A synthase [Polynucleobacter sp. 24-46-87]OZA77456.1 MAG: heme A synthase [Polynucleobacter sp. 39-46-10]